MIWSGKKSIALTIAVTLLFLTALAALIFLMPYLSRLYVAVTGNGMLVYRALVSVFYLCAAPALAALVLLTALLRALGRGEVFTRRNVRFLRWISWCSLLVAAVIAVGAVWYVPLLILAVAFAFIALIVRVVKNIMDAAVQLKMESELTI